MKLRLWLAILQSLLALTAAFATYARNVEATDRPAWLATRAVVVKDHALLLGLAAAAGIIVVQFLAVWIGHYTVRRAALQRIADTLASQLPGRAKVNRVTIFRVASGYRAVLVCLWRLRWRYWLEPRKRRLKRLWRMPWAAEYLVPYVRSSGARNPNSASAFRVSDREHECEGVAGLAWEEGFLVRPNLPPITHDDVRKVESWDSLQKRRANDPVKRYATLTGMRSLEHLQAFSQYGRHFMGTVIMSPADKSKPWGVLLLDSEQASCPFDGTDPTGGCFGQQFKSTSEILGGLVK